MCRIGANAPGAEVASDDRAITGSTLGVIVDARPRPLTLPADDAARIKRLRAWMDALDALPSDLDTATATVVPSAASTYTADTLVAGGMTETAGTAADDGIPEPDAPVTAGETTPDTQIIPTDVIVTQNEDETPATKDPYTADVEAEPYHDAWSVTDELSPARYDLTLMENDSAMQPGESVPVEDEVQFTQSPNVVPKEDAVQSTQPQHVVPVEDETQSTQLDDAVFVVEESESLRPSSTESNESGEILVPYIVNENSIPVIQSNDSVEDVDGSTVDAEDTSTLHAISAQSRDDMSNTVNEPAPEVTADEADEPALVSAMPDEPQQDDIPALTDVSTPLSTHVEEGETTESVSETSTIPIAERDDGDGSPQASPETSETQAIPVALSHDMPIEAPSSTTIDQNETSASTAQQQRDDDTDLLIEHLVISQPEQSEVPSPEPDQKPSNEEPATTEPMTNEQATPQRSLAVMKDDAPSDDTDAPRKKRRFLWW